MSTTAATPVTHPADARALPARCVGLVADGTYDDLRRHVHPDAVNREALAEPPACRGTGPDAFWATALWLRSAFADIVFDTSTVLVDGDLAVTHGTMSGRHVGPFVLWSPDGRVERAFAPTGRSFTVVHAHFLRFEDGLLREHWAVRDDQGLALQLGWVPPSPRYLLRCGIAARRARRAHL